MELISGLIVREIHLYNMKRDLGLSIDFSSCVILVREDFCRCFAVEAIELKVIGVLYENRPHGLSVEQIAERLQAVLGKSFMQQLRNNLTRYGIGDLLVYKKSFYSINPNWLDSLTKTSRSGIKRFSYRSLLPQV